MTLGDATALLVQIIRSVLHACKSWNLAVTPITKRKRLFRQRLPRLHFLVARKKLGDDKMPRQTAVDSYEGTSNKHYVVV